MRISCGAVMLAVLAAICVPCAADFDRTNPAIASRLAAWNVVLQSLPAHPMSRTALEDILAVIPEASRPDKLMAIVEAFDDEPLGIYALETWHEEGGAPSELAGLMDRAPRSRVAGKAFTLSLDAAEDPVQFCNDVIARHPGTPARLARVHLADVLAEQDDWASAFRLMLPVFAELLTEDAARAGRLFPKVRDCANRAELWLLRSEIDAFLGAPDAQAQYRAVVHLLPLLDPPPENEGVTTPRMRLAETFEALNLGDVEAFAPLAREAIASLSSDTGEPVTLATMALSLQQMAHVHRDKVEGEERAICESVAREAAWIVLEIAARPTENEDLKRDLLARAVQNFHAQGRWEPERDALKQLIPTIRLADDRRARNMRLATMNYFYWRNYEQVIAAEEGVFQDLPETERRESTRYAMAIAKYLLEDYSAALAHIEDARVSGTELTRDRLLALEALVKLRQGDYETCAALLRKRLNETPLPAEPRHMIMLLAYADSLIEGDAAAIPGYLRVIEMFPDHRSARSLRHILRNLESDPLAQEAAMPQARADAPNVLLLSLDTVRADFLGCYGDTRTQTPNIDALAGRGVRFERAFSTSSWTKPAHASVFTGCFAQTHGAMRHNERVSTAWPVLPEILLGQGYETLGVISAPPLQRIFGFGRGFLRYDDQTYLLARQADVYLHRAGKPAVDIHDGSTGSVITDRAVEILKRRKHATRPFFLFVNYFDAHHSYLPPFREGRPRYAGTQYGEIDSLITSVGPVDAPEDVVDATRLQDLYREEIQYVDQQVGRLVEHLKNSGKLDNTIVVLFSDHGDEFMEHGNLAHGRTLHNEVLTVPLIIAGPGIGAGQSVSAPVSLADVLPTLLAQLEIDAPEDLDGVAVLDSGKSVTPEDRNLLAWLDLPPYQYHALINADHKFLLGTETGDAHLYDLESDWGEQHDIAADAPSVAAALAGELAAQRARSSEIQSRRTAGTSLVIEAAPETLDELKQQLRALGYVH